MEGRRSSDRITKKPDRLGFQSPLPGEGDTPSIDSGSVEMAESLYFKDTPPVRHVKMPDGRRFVQETTSSLAEYCLYFFGKKTSEFTNEQLEYLKVEWKESNQVWMLDDEEEDDNKRPRAARMMKIHLKTHDIVRFIHDGEEVTARVLIVTPAMAQVQILNNGSVVMKKKTSLVFVERSL